MRTEFAIIPAYFYCTGCDEAEREHNEIRIDNWIKAKMPLTSQSNEKVFGMFRMRVSALVYYDDLLKEHIHRNSMARRSTFFTEKTPLAKFLITDYPWNNTSATPEITGIPADVLVIAKMEDMKVIMSDLKSLLETSFKTTLASKLDAKQVGGSAYDQSKYIMTKLYTLLLRSTAISSSDPEHIDIDDTGVFVDIEYDVVFFLGDEDKGDKNMVDNPNILSTNARDRIVRQKLANK